MPPPEYVLNNSDSLIDLLGAQCSDLEALLGLAREESVAAQDGNFLTIWEIVSKRAAIGERLETFQHQIAELRGHLESKGETLHQPDITSRVIELSNLTLAQDQKTRLLLVGLRDETVKDQNNLERSSHSTNAYLRENTKGLAYNRQF